MITIRKYRIPLCCADGEHGAFVLDIPFGWRVVHVGLDGQDEPSVWASGDTKADAYGVARRQLCLIGTGHEVPRNGEYVGTFVVAPYVWHLYECSAVLPAKKQVMGAALA